MQLDLTPDHPLEETGLTECGGILSYSPPTLEGLMLPALRQASAPVVIASRISQIEWQNPIHESRSITQVAAVDTWRQWAIPFDIPFLSLQFVLLKRKWNSFILCGLDLHINSISYDPSSPQAHYRDLAAGFRARFLTQPTIGRYGALSAKSRPARRQSIGSFCSKGQTRLLTSYSKNLRQDGRLHATSSTSYARAQASSRTGILSIQLLYYLPILAPGMTTVRLAANIVRFVVKQRPSVGQAFIGRNPS